SSLRLEFAKPVLPASVAVQPSMSPIPCKILNKLIPACYPAPMFAKLRSRRPASLRHVTKNPSPQLLYFPHLQNRDARNSFRFRSYVNWRVSPALFSLSLSSHSPYTLPSYVSCKSCIRHSYAPFASRTVLRDENTGGMGVFFPFWNAPIASRIFYKNIGEETTFSLRPFDFQLSTVNLFPSNSFPLNPFADPHP